MLATGFPPHPRVTLYLADDNTFGENFVASLMTTRSARTLLHREANHIPFRSNVENVKQHYY